MIKPKDSKDLLDYFRQFIGNPSLTEMTIRYGKHIVRFERIGSILIKNGTGFQVSFKFININNNAYSKSFYYDTGDFKYHWMIYSKPIWAKAIKELLEKHKVYR